MMARVFSCWRPSSSSWVSRTFTFVMSSCSVNEPPGLSKFAVLWFFLLATGDISLHVSDSANAQHRSFIRLRGKVYVLFFTKEISSSHFLLLREEEWVESWKSRTWVVENEKICSCRVLKLFNCFASKVNNGAELNNRSKRNSQESSQNSI